GGAVITPLRFVNAAIETSLPSVLLWTISRYWGPVAALGAWPSMLYFVFIVASTLRLDFALPAFTGAVAAVGYTLVAFLVAPLSTPAEEPALAPLYHLTKAVIMLVAGVVAGPVDPGVCGAVRAAPPGAAAAATRL